MDYFTVKVVAIILTCTWMVALSNEMNNIGKISVRISSGGVFSKIICKFSNMVTDACIDFGCGKVALQ